MVDNLGATVAAIRAGAIVAYPTEGVWGLGCDPSNREAAERLLALKQRPMAKGLILLAAEETQLAPWIAPFDPVMAERIRATWPGPATWIVPSRPDCPDWLTGTRDTLAVRVTAHPPARALCAAAGMALVSTSANPSGEAPLITLEAVRDTFGSALGAVLDGPLGDLKSPTEIRDARTGHILRPAEATRHT
ncbi:MAG: L-threonylcarbamoyladenylate synthase [Gammaproteobacteria bacterium]